MCVGCFGLVVSTCQVIGWKDPSEDTLMWWGDYLHKAQVEECLCVFFVCLVCLCSCVSPPGPTQYIFHTPMTWYSLFVLKVPLNTNKTNKQTIVPQRIIERYQIGVVSRSWVGRGVQLGPQIPSTSPVGRTSRSITSRMLWKFLISVFWLTVSKQLDCIYLITDGRSTENCRELLKQQVNRTCLFGVRFWLFFYHCRLFYI